VLHHWLPQQRVPLASPEPPVQQAARAWVLLLPVRPESTVPLQEWAALRRGLPRQEKAQGLVSASVRRPPDLALLS
jgi:hypothetical protein